MITIKKMSVVQSGRIQPNPGPKDPFFSSVSLLISGETRSDGTFFDHSPNNFAVTSSGTIVRSSTTPFSGTGVSINTTGTTGGVGYGAGHLSVPSSNILNFGTADYTVEYWCKLNNVSGSLDQGIIDSGDNPGVRFATYKNSVPNKLLIVKNGVALIWASATASINVWYYVAASRVGGTTRLFINGNLDGSSADTENYDSTSFWLASFRTGMNGINGYLSNIRVTKGVGRYTGSFSVPTAPFLTQ